jgi:hypothetical protein
MAKIVTGIGTSHVPSIGAVIDHDKEQDAYWKPLFEMEILTTILFEGFIYKGCINQGI